MSFHHLAGITTPGAPDEIDDWFSTFEAWITATVGWTIASGAGTSNLRIWSEGEVGGLTMLFVHVYRVGVGNTIRMEVSDDGVPTHETNEAGTLDSGGVQFPWWMTADLDSMVICWKVGAGYRTLYAGLVMPFALTVPDETYHSITISNMMNASILRRHDGVWDQDDALYSNAYMLGARRDRDDASLTIGGLMFADNADIAGQLKHVSCRITDPPTSPEDTLTTGQPGATTEWIILRDSLGIVFAMRTGGVLPTGRADGAAFAHVTGVAANITAWFTALAAFMTARGWAVTDITGVSGRMWDLEFNSAGEDGTEDIWFRISAVGIGSAVVSVIADSALGTPGRHEVGSGQPGLDNADFPTNYYFTGDADCLLYTLLRPDGRYWAIWQGLASVFAPGLSSTYMKTVLMQNLTGWILLRHDGTWGPGAADLAAPAFGDGNHAQNSNPNNYDGTTYLVWPYSCRQTAPAEPIGGLKYFFASSGGGIAMLDTITVGARIYTVFSSDGVTFWAMRTT